MSKVKWDSFDRVAVIVTPTGLSDVYGWSGFTNVYLSLDAPWSDGSEIRYYAAEHPVAFENPMTKSWVELFESAPDSIDIHIACYWGDEDPLTMDVELRLMDADGNDVLVGTQSIDRSDFSPNEYGDAEAVVTFNTSGMFGAGEDTGAAGHYLFRTGDMPGINLPAPEPLPPPASPVLSRPPSSYKPPRPILSGAPLQSLYNRETLVKEGFILSRVCSYDGLNTGFDNGVTCRWVRTPHENLYFFKDWEEFEKYRDRFERMDRFKDPARAGIHKIPEYII